VGPAEEANGLGGAQGEVGWRTPGQGAEHAARQLDHAPACIQPDVLPLHRPAPVPRLNCRPPHTLDRPRPARGPAAKIEHPVRLPAVTHDGEPIARHVERVEGGAVDVGHQAGQER